MAGGINGINAYGYGANNASRSMDRRTFGPVI